MPQNHVNNFFNIYKWSIVPFIGFISAISGLYTTYRLADQNCHVQTVKYAYISDTGNYYPERMLFGMVITILAVSYVYVIILNFNFIKSLLSLQDSTRSLDSTYSISTKRNKLTLITGLISSLGLFIIANFQAQSAPFIHYSGAVSGFLLGAVYNLLTVITLSKVHKFWPEIVPAWLVRIRWGIVVIGMICFICFFGMHFILPFLEVEKYDVAAVDANGRIGSLPMHDVHNNSTPIKYYSTDQLSNPNCHDSTNPALTKIIDQNGLQQTVVLMYSERYNFMVSLSAIFEWISGMCNIIFNGLFVFEFSKIEFLDLKVGVRVSGSGRITRGQIYEE